MDENNKKYDPWDYGVYETGRTRPPKNYGGIIALLLVIVIFLGGLVGVLSALNIKLFAKLNSPDDGQNQVSFVSETLKNEMPTAAASTDESTPVSDTFSSEGVPFVLNPSPESVENVLQEGGLSLQEIYEKNIDSVVSITCTTGSGSATGTGVIFSADGYIVTNCHVVEGATRIVVLLTDERQYAASLVGADSVSDLAVLYIEASGLTAAEFGDSAALRVGDSVAAIGDPLGTEFRGSLTNGIVSAINRDVTTGGRTLTLIQTNAALNSGNSGGPLINCYGQVIGINTMKIGAFTDDAGVEGLGFAIPTTTVQEIVLQLIRQGYVSGRPTLGITGESLSGFYQRYYRMPAGLYITAVEEDSAADRVGIMVGDILVSIDGTSASGTDAINTILAGHEVGDTVEVVIYRGGRQYTAQLELTEAKG